MKLPPKMRQFFFSHTMKKSVETHTIQPHAIQLKAILVEELHIEVKRQQPDQEPNEYPIRVFVAHSPYDAERKIIQVGIKAETSDPDSTPYNLIVEILGIFDVDESAFPIKEINHWAEFNAPYILFPFLREQIHSLTFRAGQKPAILPLFTMPSQKPLIQERATSRVPKATVIER